MASIEILNSRIDAVMCTDLGMYPIAPSGEFITPIEHILMPCYEEGTLTDKLIRHDLAHKFKSMKCGDICGTQTLNLLDPFVAAKVCTPVMSAYQIQSFAKMIIGPRRLQTPFDFFLETVFGIDRPNEYNGGVFIDTPPTEVILATVRHCFREWGGSVVFSKEINTKLF